MEFAIVTLQRSLDLSKNYKPLQVGNMLLGLQTIQDDAAEIEVQSGDALTKLRIPIGTSAKVKDYTFICLDVGVALPKEKKRFRLLGGKDNIPPDGIMEAVLDIRWGDQSMRVANPPENAAYDFLLVRQYELLNDRARVYNDQDTLVFGDLALQLGERVEEGSRNFKNPKYAELRVKQGADDEETVQLKLDGDYQKIGDYRVKVTSFDIANGWYQAVGISIARGKMKGEVDETQRNLSSGVSSADLGDASVSRTRLDEAEANPNECVLKIGQTKNVGKVGIKLLELKPGKAQVMFLSPKIARTTLTVGEVFDFGKWDVALVGIHGDKAIIRVVEE